jgi:hypothetical protein
LGDIIKKPKKTGSTFLACDWDEIIVRQNYIKIITVAPSQR